MNTVKLSCGRSIRRKARKLDAMWTDRGGFQKNHLPMQDMDNYEFSSYTVYCWDNPVADDFPYSVMIYDNLDIDISYHFCMAKEHRQR